MEKKRIAVIGMSCKFAGAENTEKLWDMMVEEKCSFKNIEERIPDYLYYYSENETAKGKAYNKQAAFLEQGIHLFDSDFFELSDKEVSHMDSQQRLLLETSYEALEDAGIVIHGTDTGVFIGGFTQDSLTQNMQEQNVYHVNQYYATGNSIGMLASKLSYFYDLHGPSISVDTACSSSLTALYYACKSIEDKDCRIALCGGVSIISDIGYFIALSKGGFLSKTSLCHAFGAEADGYARGEGVGILILKDLNEAIRDKDNIYCEINAACINHDGRSNGITLPNPDAQVNLLQSTLEKAKISCNSVGYVEAHGTGTQAGDIAEAKALNQVFQNRNSDLYIGSIKTNIGHTEAAAGIAGVIKSILILKNRKIPKSLHCETKNPNIPFEYYKIKPADSIKELKSEENGKSYILINSFGFGGANACAIISNYENEIIEEPKQDLKFMHLLMLSAKSKKALKDLVSQYIESFKNGECKDVPIHEVCMAAALRRSHYGHRLCVYAKNKNDIINTLEMYLKNIITEKLFYNFCHEDDNQKAAFIFSGTGAQHRKMGVSLYQNIPEFKRFFDECSQEYFKISRINLLDYIVSEESFTTSFFDSIILQPFNVAYQISLFKLYELYGVKCGAIAGHSAGEMSAFYCSGMLSLENVFRLAFYRSSVMQKIEGKGKMLALGITRERANEVCMKYENQVSLAVVNSPSMIVLSGPENILIEVKKGLNKKIYSKFLEGNIAYHSSQLNEVKEEFLHNIAGICMDENNPSIRLYSSVTGKAIRKEEIDFSYWWDNIRKTVEFNDLMNLMADDGYHCFIEIGAKPVLSYFVREIFTGKGKDLFYLVSQKENDDQCETFFAGLAKLYCEGNKIDLSRYYTEKVRNIKLPSYCFYKKELKAEITHNQYVNIKSKAMYLLGRKMNMPFDSWESVINLYSHPDLRGHRVEDNILFPAAGYIQMIIESGVKQIYNMQVNRPLALTDSADIIFQCVRKDPDNFYIYASDEKRTEWLEYCSACCHSNKSNEIDHKINYNDQILSIYLGEDAIYEVLKKKSLMYQENFKCLKKAEIKENEAVAWIKETVDMCDPKQFAIVIDGMLQTVALAIKAPLEKESRQICLPSGIEKIQYMGNSGEELHTFVSIYWKNGCQYGRAYLLDESENVLIAMEGIQLSTTQKKENMIDADVKAYKSVWEEIHNFKGKNELLEFIELSEGCCQGICHDMDKASNNTHWIYYASDDYRKDCLNMTAILKKASGKKIQLVVITINAMKILQNDTVCNSDQSVLWGVVRSIQAEYPNLYLRLIDLDKYQPFHKFSYILKSDETELGVREDKIFGLRIKEIEQDSNFELITEPSIVTGASGGVGYEWALHLGQRGVKKIGLLSRRENNRIKCLLEVFTYYNIEARHYRIDVSDLEACNWIWNEIKRDFGCISQVYHLAGISKDCLAINLSEEILIDNMKPKITGTKNIYQLLNQNVSKGQKLTLHLFGSVSALLGSIGQAAYAGANSFLESYCENINAKKDGSISCRFIGFGALDTGMAVLNQSIARGLEKQNILFMKTEDAIKASAKYSTDSCYILKIDWSGFVKQKELSNMQKYQYVAEKQLYKRGILRKKIMLMNKKEQMESLHSFLAESFAAVLECNSDSIDLEKQTNVMGINSLNSIMIVAIINKELESDFVFNQVVGPFSILELAKFIHSELFADG